MTDMSSMDELEENLRERVKTLDQASRKQYYTRLEKEVRDPDTFAVLNYFFVAGLHHFYLHKWLRGFINLGLMLYGISIILGFHDYESATLGLLIICGVYLFELYELFRSEQIVRMHNYRLGLSVLKDLEKRKGRQDVR